MSKNKGAMTVAEAGRKGGATTAQRHGPEFYEQIGKKGGRTTAQRHGADDRAVRQAGQQARSLGVETVSVEGHLTLQVGVGPDPDHPAGPGRQGAVADASERVIPPRHHSDEQARAPHDKIGTRHGVNRLLCPACSMARAEDIAGQRRGRRCPLPGAPDQQRGRPGVKALNRGVVV